MLAQIATRYESEASFCRPDLRLVHSANVIAVPELDEDIQIKKDADNVIRSLGYSAIGGEVEPVPISNDSLLSAIKRARTGNVEARAMVAANVGSDFSERVLKAGEVTKYQLKKDNHGKLIQHGQLYSDIYVNTLRATKRNSKMRPRAEAETRNAKRIESLESQGKLADNYMLVFSLAPDDMTDKELKEAGFFVGTKTMAIQLTGADGDGISIESAFVAAVTEDGARRHDKDAIVKLGRMLGIDYGNMTTTEILDTPLLIPKSFLKNGVIDLVKLYDDLAGGTFFGQNKPRQDYKAYRAFCDERRAGFAGEVRAVTQKLINGADSIHTQIDAIERLAQLSEEQMVRRAIHDQTIDARVFGRVSATHIMQARRHLEQGNYEMARMAERDAIKTADSDSCPSGIGRQSEIDTDTDNKKTEKLKDCDFVSKKCPICGEKNAKTKVKSGVYYHVGRSCKSE